MEASFEAFLRLIMMMLSLCSENISILVFFVRHKSVGVNVNDLVVLLHSCMVLNYQVLNLHLSS